MILDALLTSSCQRLLATIIDFCKDSYYTDSVFINKNPLFTIAHNAIVYFALYKTFPTSFTRVWCPGKWASELDLEAIYCDGYQSFDRILISIYPYLLFLSDILNCLTIGCLNLNLLSQPSTTLAPQTRQARVSGENLNYVTLAPQTRQARPRSH